MSLLKPKSKCMHSTLRSMIVHKNSGRLDSSVFQKQCIAFTECASRLFMHSMYAIGSCKTDMAKKIIASSLHLVLNKYCLFLKEICSPTSYCIGPKSKYTYLMFGYDQMLTFVYDMKVELIECLHECDLCMHLNHQGGMVKYMCCGKENPRRTTCARSAIIQQRSLMCVHSAGKVGSVLKTVSCWQT